VESRIVVAKNCQSDSNAFDNPESGVSCDGMVGGEESKVHRELENSVLGRQSETMVRSDCSPIVGISETENEKEKENDTKEKGEMKLEIPPDGTASPLSVSVPTLIPAKSTNLSEAQNGTVDVLADEQSADDGKQTRNNSDPQNIDEPTVPVLTATMAEPVLNVSVKGDILQNDQNGKDDSVEPRKSRDENGKDHSVGSEKSGGESEPTSQNLDSETSAVHLTGGSEKVTSDSKVVEVTDDGLLPTMESQMVQNVPFVKNLTGFEEVCPLQSSRFGSTKYLRRKTAAGEWEYFVGKFYNVGESRDTSIMF
jgi:hypothetical protein